MNTMDSATLAAHAAICEDSPEDCLEWEGRCIKAVEAAAPHIIAATIAAIEQEGSNVAD